MYFKDLTPTTHPDLFVSHEGRLVHRVVGPLKHHAAHLMSLPDQSTLQIYHDAPEVELRVLPPSLAQMRTQAGTDGARTIATITGYVNDMSSYLTVVTTALEVLDLLIQAVDETEEQLAAIDQQLQNLMVKVGANDYLALLRRMADMRGNARMIVNTLSALRTLIEGSPAASWYRDQLVARDAQLHADINALLEPSEAYFRRTYVESLIAGDGLWMHAIPDRPVDSSGTTFEYRMALPTVVLLIAVRLTMMKFTVPDFVSRSTFSVEIDHWWRRLQQLADQMAFHVRETKVTPVEIQAARRQQAGERPGSFVDWQKHCTVAPPFSISPIGAIDITTGFGTIEWQYVQFDEWYLRHGDLHGRDAGYWPPSIGIKWYQPPPNATGLPPLEKAINDYYSMAAADARHIARQVQDQIGVTATNILAWSMFDLAHPGVGTPI